MGVKRCTISPSCWDEISSFEDQEALSYPWVNMKDCYDWGWNSILRLTQDRETSWVTFPPDARALIFSVCHILSWARMTTQLQTSAGHPQTQLQLQERCFRQQDLKASLCYLPFISKDNTIFCMKSKLVVTNCSRKWRAVLDSPPQGPNREALGRGHQNPEKVLVAQWYPILWASMDCSLPGSSVHGLFHTRILETGHLPNLGIELRSPAL